MITETELTGTYIGRKKLGFETNHDYKLIVKENKKRGYAIMTSYDLTDNIEKKLFCPYSSEISIRAEWKFNS